MNPVRPSEVKGLEGTKDYSNLQQLKIKKHVMINLRIIEWKRISSLQTAWKSLVNVLNERISHLWY